VAQSTANTRVRFEQWAKNPECEANTVSAVLNVRMGKVAASLGLPDNKGISPFAVTRGYLFERRLFDEEAAVLREHLERKNVLPAGSRGFADFRLKANFGTSVSTMEEALKQSEQFIRSLANGGSVPSIVTGLTIRLPQGVMLPEATLILDVMTALKGKDGRIELQIGEIKVFPDRGGYTDPQHLATARAQAGVYLYGIESWLEAEGLLSSFNLPTTGFLVFTWPGTSSPVVRASEDLSEQKERAKRGFINLDEVAQRVVGVSLDEYNPDEYEAWVKHSRTAYAEKCWGFCDLAARCQLVAVREDRGIVLGTEVARALGAVSIGRTISLLNGAQPRDATESALAAQLSAVDWNSNGNA
jgi:hypothetical protein